VLSSQMTWATLAHVANDWLAVPLAVWTLVWMMRAARSATVFNVAAASLMLSAGLLTKSYFLALVPVWAAVTAIRGRARECAVSAGIVAICAGPWYARNYLFYGAWTGMQEARAGIGPAKVLRAAFSLDWPAVAASGIRGALWTGNNTFHSFSVGTMNLLVAVCAAAFLLWVFSRHEGREWVVAGYLWAFGAAIGYAAVVTFVRTGNPLSTPSAWYAQVLVAPMLGLAMLGAARWGGFGKLGRLAITLLFGYVAAVSYVFKLIPMYAGYEGRGSVGEIAALYGERFWDLYAKLDSVALGPGWLVLGLAGGVVVMIGLAAWEAAAGWEPAPLKRF
jgi:hypothetical protein